MRFLPFAALAFVLGCNASPAPRAPRAPTPAAPAAAAVQRDVIDEVERLAASDHFGSAHVGYGGTADDRIQALRAILARPDAPQALATVLERGTLAGQLMALAGLYSVDRARYNAVAPSYATRTEAVPVRQSGCRVHYRPVPASEIVALFDTGLAADLRGR